MLQNRLSEIKNMTIVKTFGKPAMFICDTDKLAPEIKGEDRGIKAWNPSFWQLLYIHIRS